MKSKFHFLMFFFCVVLLAVYTYAVADLASNRATRTVIDKDLCYAVSSQQGQYIGFKLTLDNGYTAYICKGKVE